MKIGKLPAAQLTARDYEGLERCFISHDVADAAYLRRVTDFEARGLFGIGERPGNYAGIVFPYFEVETRKIRCYRLRRDQPDLEGRDGMIVERRKYVSAPNEPNRLYFPPGVVAAWVSERPIPIVVVEGEKKVLALWAVAWHGLSDSAECPRFLPVGLSGVWSWRGRIGKAPGPDGSRRDVKGVIPDLSQMPLLGREVSILFDANARKNEDVAEARRQLAGWLAGQGAMVRVADLPCELGINGPDDAAAVHGAPYILNILREALPFERSDAPIRVLSSDEEKVVQEHPYRGFLFDYEHYARARLPEVPAAYHTLTGLILMGGVLASKLTTDFGLKCNLSGVIVAFQGSGKSLPSMIARDLIGPIEEDEAVEYDKTLSLLKRQMKNAEDDDEQAEQLRKEIAEMERSGPPVIIVATQASVEGLLEALSGSPCGIADYDEFGAFLKDCRREHMRSARENFIKALDGRPIFYRRTRGQSVAVKDPALSMWGTVNVESLRAGADDEDMFGGFFSRILFCATDYEFSIPFPQRGNEEQAGHLQAVLHTWREIASESLCVKFDPGVRERALEYAYCIAPFTRGERVNITEPEDQVAGVAYVRYGTHAQKVAILLAVSEAGDGLEEFRASLVQRAAPSLEPRGIPRSFRVWAKREECSCGTHPYRQQLFGIEMRSFWWAHWGQILAARVPNSRGDSRHGF